MSEKKRKAQAELNGQPSQKRSHITAPDPTIKVRYLRSSETTKPVIGTLSLCK
jgi:hypothetical protein